VSSDRVAAILIGVVLTLFNLPRCWLSTCLIIPLMLYGLLPRRGVKVDSKVIRIVGRVIGCLTLAFSFLLVVCLLMVNAPPWVVSMFSILFITPSLSLTLYSFELGVIPQLNPKASACIRVLVVAFVILALGFSLLVAYIDVALSPGFLTGWYEIEWPTRAGHTKVTLPGWAIISLTLALSIFLLALGFIALVKFKHIAEEAEDTLQPGWVRGRSKIGQILILAFAALLIGLGPFIYMESGVFLAGFMITAFGAYLTLLIVDLPTLQSVYKELKATLKLSK